MANLPQKADPNLLVGYATGDDAGVYRLSEDLALVMTTDVITPPVDDPFLFGQIAAANALSDVFAMGARPLACLNIIAFPSGRLGSEVLDGILAGGLDKITEAGAVLAGGHSIDDDEPKYGLAVVGTVHPDRYWANAGARPGDRLVLTKPLGSGVLFNADLKNRVPAEPMRHCIDHLIGLNRTAAEILAGYEVHAATDITGFGLAGHGFEMATASKATLTFSFNALPRFDHALAMYESGVTTGVNNANASRVAAYTVYDPSLSPAQRSLLVDPQTSGGLLAALPESQAEDAVRAMKQAGVVAAAVVGQVVASNGTDRLHFQP